MRIVIECDGSNVGLEDAANMNELYLLHRGCAEREIRSALENAGAGNLPPGGNEASISVTWLRAHALSSLPTEASAEFDAMISYASSKGWVDDAAGTVSAHLVNEVA